MKDKVLKDRKISSAEIEEQLTVLGKINREWTKDFKKRKARAPVFAIATYGCQMNERDSEHLRGMLNEAGFEKGDWDSADLLLFNTCCVRDHAEKRVFGNVGALYKRKQENPELIIGVCGCMMQQQETAKQLYKRFPFVDLVFGTHALYSFPSLLSQALFSGERIIDIHDSEGRIAENMPSERDKNVSAFVTVMYGCNNFCSYCIVPYVRGRERSRKIENILDEIKELVDGGVREITLLGQNVNSYGIDLDEDVDFSQLLKQVNEIEGLERIRFMTSHPKDLSLRLIDAMASLDKVCRHIHLPVQSGSDRILKAMNRRYSSSDYLHLLDRLRDAVPDIEVTTDIIVGFPGETEEDYQDTLNLVSRAQYSSAFTFMYSPRFGTPAAEMEDQISADEKKRRLLKLNVLQAEIGHKNNEKYIGKTLNILVEGCDQRSETLLYGKSSNFKMVYFLGNEELVGQCVDVKVTACRSNALSGEIII